MYNNIDLYQFRDRVEECSVQLMVDSHINSKKVVLKYRVSHKRQIQG